ncbi:MAG: transporter [Pseudonocardiales bacterium]|nr:MAG: transporter [Pseudonocardiales bacterium]
MTWLTWRQHRAAAVAALLLCAALGGLLLVTGLSMHTAFGRDGVASCLSTAGRPGCQDVIDGFVAQHIGLNDQLPWLIVVPALVGMFFGAPLLGREFEHGTWKLAWTQSITRTRWIAVQLTGVGALIIALSAGLTVMFAWWRAPLDAIQGRFDPASFSLAGPSFAAAALFAFALGVLAGALLRRTVPAMAATSAGYLAARLTVEACRPHYLAPLTRVIDPVRHDRHGAFTTRDWILHTGWIDRSGHHVTGASQHRIISDAIANGTDLAAYMHQHGIANYVQYQPANRYWPFQLIEAGIFLALAVMLLAAAVWVVRKRTS